jgi:histidine ammonia-lyase
MWNPKTEKYEDAASVMRAHGLEPIKLGPKEGASLAIVHGVDVA